MPLQLDPLDEAVLLGAPSGSQIVAAQVTSALWGVPGGGNAEQRIFARELAATDASLDRLAEAGLLTRDGESVLMTELGQAELARRSEADGDSAVTHTAAVAVAPPAESVTPANAAATAAPLSSPTPPTAPAPVPPATQNRKPPTWAIALSLGIALGILSQLHVL